MSRENMGIFTYFVNKGGTQFIPFGNLPEDDARLMQIVSAELGRDDPRSLSSGNVGLMGNKWERYKGIGAINKERAKVGLPPLPVDVVTMLEKAGSKPQKREKP